MLRCNSQNIQSYSGTCQATAFAAAIIIGCFTVEPALAQVEHSAPTGTGSIARMDPADAANRARQQLDALPVRVIDGLELDVWAPPGLVTDPLTLDFDSEGRAFVVSSNRAGMLLDIRQHPTWVPETHSLQTTEDLREFFRRDMAPERSDENQWLPDFNEDGSHDYNDLTVVPETVFRVEDTDGDGIADRSQVVHEGLNDDIAADIAGGILYRDGDLYVTIAPDLWLLRDTTGDGIYDSTESISHGYSVHPAFSGHDMSALATGPDGRIYWKIGDIGMSVVDETGRRWSHPTTGAVLRSEPDGSNFEVFAWGLRNTQEIAFDKHGNLVSVDNDGDHAGETERVVYIVQGSDAGWRSTWQYGKYTDAKNNSYNVWMEEGLSRTRWDGQAAYITPPIAPHRSGPSGVAYNPGTALSSEWNDHFFVTSFTGGASNASLYGFQLTESGAGFELASDTQMIGGLLSSGIVFGPDGALYLTDWVSGWGSTGEGALWRLDATGAANTPVRREVQQLLNEDFTGLSPHRLQTLMAHADMRIRQRAQFELAARKDAESLRAVAFNDADQLARLHGIWGLGQLARAGDSEAVETVRPLLQDDDKEVRAQTAKTLGDVRDTASLDALISATDDPEPRVRFFATEALGRIGNPTAIGAIVAMLEANNDEDVYLRTAGYHALASIGDADAVVALAVHPSEAVRVAAVVALRRMQHPEASEFIDDASDYVATEAARAINDEQGILPALPDLAAALGGPISNEAFDRRALSANLRVGDRRAAERVGHFAANDQADDAMRIEAIEILGVWPDPSRHDRVDGAWIGQLAARDSDAARLAAADLLSLLNSSSSDETVRVAILETATQLAVAETADHAIRRLELDPSTAVRIAALQSLRTLGGEQAERGIALALADSDAAVREAAINAVPTMALDDNSKIAQLESLIQSPEVDMGERQSAIAALAGLPLTAAEPALAQLLARVEAGEIPAELQLDLFEAVAAGNSEILQMQLEQSGVGRQLQTLAEVFPEALQFGGSADAGDEIVMRHQAAQCVRCHSIGESTSTVGPPLGNIGSKLSRDELLESMLDPGASIAEGFGDADAASAMPAMDLLLTPGEIRDVIEFLAGQRN